ncbi:MAG: PEP-CTERM sorting domain-containing protein [Alphaproteobacteria bacterium]|nr:PEP-CTERM sorting domain-containing protein [Alphaproteobacteria bacterium]
MITRIGSRTTGASWLHTLFAVAVALPLLATGAAAAVFTIDFESEPADSTPDSFYFVDAGGLDFAFTGLPTGLIAIIDPGAVGTSLFPRLHPSNRTLAASFTDGLGALVMGSRLPIASLSFEIGFDIPEGTTELGDLVVTSPTVALLFALIDDTATPDLSSMVVLPLNRNFLVDQTLAYAGAPHQAFLVVFAIPAAPDDPEDLRLLGYRPIASPAIVIDNLSFEIADAVPAPATLPALAAGLAGLGLARRRRS